MSEPFLGEIKMFGGNFAILGYAFCNGALLDISQNDALYSLLGTTYGGDGVQNFGLPDLQGRIPVHYGSGPGLTPRSLGEKSGTETVTLTTQQMASHNHPVRAFSGNGSATNPAGNFVAGSTANPYNTSAVDSQMGNQSIGNMGSSGAHDNIMPFQCINFIIALQGIYPPRS